MSPDLRMKLREVNVRLKTENDASSVAINGVRGRLFSAELYITLGNSHRGCTCFTQKEAAEMLLSPDLINRNFHGFGQYKRSTYFESNSELNERCTFDLHRLH